MNNVEHFIREVYPAACEYSQISGISPLFVTAQAALESGWGRSKIGRYNIFGITRGSNWHGRTLLHPTTEYFSRGDFTLTPPEQVISIKRLHDKRYQYRVMRLFRDYDSLRDALADHCRVLSGKGYSDAWAYRGDAREFLRRIQDNVGWRYATAPNYVEILMRVIDMVELNITRLGLNKTR